MTLPTLTPTQTFQSRINIAIQQCSMIFNPDNSSGLVSVYTRIYNTIFNYPGQTAAASITQLSTNAGGVLAILQSVNDFLTAGGVTDLPAVPAHTVNSDGTVTLTA